MILHPLLSWKTHITELSKKLARSVGIFYKLRYLVPQHTARTLCYALMHPFILYGVTIWGLTYPTYLDPILKLQKQFLRIITFSYLMAHSDPLFIRFAILKVHDLHKLQLGNFVFTWKQQSTLAQFKSCFTPATSVHDYNTRYASGGNLALPNINTTHYGICSIKFYGAKLSNSVPGDCRDSSTSHYFRNRFSKYLLDQYYNIV